ncbi:hypothetical protein SASPL_110624 [Salvia splendens]|uniref:Uncharacterized protein n=1 Tax=Salvia splendens TaxID=180675 RepID=A0A8X9A3I3_SALSN|nr:hypothetical protein SASPL_110624 [Salvia splendens]
MAHSNFSLCFVVVFLQFCVILVQVAGGSEEIIYEDGYTVTTLINGDKSNIKVNPQSILHQSPPSISSSFSTPLPALSTPHCCLQPQPPMVKNFDLLSSSNRRTWCAYLGGQTVMKKLAGNEVFGYVDGDLLQQSVTTIAGGYSQKAGHADGPARDASFSDNFELAFIAEMCALLISDHGNRLVRQISLRPEDCSRQSGSVLGTTSAWLLGMGLCSVISLAVGLVIRPYVIPYTGRRQTLSAPLDMDTLPNESGETSTDALLRLEKRSFISQQVADQLKDLLTFDKGLLMAPVNTDETAEPESSKHERQTIDGMIKANLASFEGEALKVDSFDSRLDWSRLNVVTIIGFARSRSEQVMRDTDEDAVVSWFAAASEDRHPIQNRRHGSA